VHFCRDETRFFRHGANHRHERDGDDQGVGASEVHDSARLVALWLMVAQVLPGPPVVGQLAQRTGVSRV
jgi:hypothetical protein